MSTRIFLRRARRLAKGGPRSSPVRALLSLLAVLSLLLSGSGLTHAQAAQAASPFGPMNTMKDGAMEMVVLPPSGKAPTWTEVSKVYTELDAAKAATAKYQNVATAKSDGYLTAPILFVAEQGYHYVNPRYVQEWRAGHYDYSQPPVLVYNKVDGKLVLSGLMYLVPRSTTPQQLASIFPASMAGWHRHINDCIQGDGFSGKLLPYHSAATCSAHGGRFSAAGTGWMTHAWIWSGSASTGLFDTDIAPSSMKSGMPGM